MSEPSSETAGRDWVDHTPEAKTAYRLAMENRESLGFDQCVMLDRGEYEELKRHLACVRGLDCAPDDPNSDARLLPLRAFYRRLAAVLSDDEFNCSLRALTEAVRVCEDCRGSSTPAESFVYRLLRGGSPLTPEDVEIDFAEFRTEFNCMSEESRAFVARYPKA